MLLELLDAFGMALDGLEAIRALRHERLHCSEVICQQIVTFCKRDATVAQLCHVELVTPLLGFERCLELGLLLGTLFDERIGFGTCGLERGLHLLQTTLDLVQRILGCPLARMGKRRKACFERRRDLSALDGELGKARLEISLPVRELFDVCVHLDNPRIELLESLGVARASLLGNDERGELVIDLRDTHAQGGLQVIGNCIEDRLRTLGNITVCGLHMCGNGCGLHGDLVAMHACRIERIRKLVEPCIARRGVASMRKPWMLDRTAHGAWLPLFERFGEHARAIGVVEALCFEQR